MLYSFPFLRMATNNQIPIMAAAKNKMIPIREIPKIRGGVSDMTISADPTMRAAMIMEKETRLEI
jgi:hypothetical protein